MDSSGKLRPRMSKTGESTVVHHTRIRALPVSLADLHLCGSFLRRCCTTLLQTPGVHQTYCTAVQHSFQTSHTFRRSPGLSWRARLPAFFCDEETYFTVDIATATHTIQQCGCSPSCIALKLWHATNITLHSGNSVPQLPTILFTFYHGNQRSSQAAFG
jgi:hypothetical protein